METTFLITKQELDSDFLTSIKNLFKHQKQLQIAISVPEDFNLYQTETPVQHIKRLEKCLKEMKQKKNVISFDEAQLDEMIFEKL